MPGRRAQYWLVAHALPVPRRLGVGALRSVAALAGVHAALAATPDVAAAGAFSFARTDYLLRSQLNGLGSVAVADVDGVNGPDIVVLSYTGGVGPSTVNVLLNKGD